MSRTTANKITNKILTSISAAFHPSRLRHLPRIRHIANLNDGSLLILDLGAGYKDAMSIELVVPTENRVARLAWERRYCDYHLTGRFTKQSLQYVDSYFKSLPDNLLNVIDEITNMFIGEQAIKLNVNSTQGSHSDGTQGYDIYSAASVGKSDQLQRALEEQLAKRIASIRDRKLKGLELTQLWESHNKTVGLCHKPSPLLRADS